MNLKPARTSLLLAAVALTVSACTAEGTHSPTAELTSATGPDTTTKTLAPGASQAFAATTDSAVEKSVEALAAPAEVRKRKVVTKTVKVRRSAMIALPGVRKDKSVLDLAPVARKTFRKAKALSEPVRVASAAALARIGRHGLRTQHSKVSVGCLKPRLVGLIKKAERHFGRHAVVTSGYRSPRHNRRIGGARKSMHVSCLAADIQIKGVTKWKLASWLRQQEGRGGVGTYCHTQSVHIDIGKKRDWNWRCKRRRGKRRKA